MKKLIVAVTFAAGMLAAPLLATAAGASGAGHAQVSSCASWVGGFASSSTYEGAGIGTTGYPPPYGQLVQLVAHINGSC